MPSKMLESIIRILAEGTTVEKLVEKAEVHKEAAKLAEKLPPAPYKQVYVGNILRQTLKGDIDVEVFKEFVKTTNTYLEVERVAPRVKMLMKKG